MKVQHSNPTWAKQKQRVLMALERFLRREMSEISVQRLQSVLNRYSSTGIARDLSREVARYPCYRRAFSLAGALRAVVFMMPREDVCDSVRERIRNAKPSTRER